jgi:hypothetical protein
MNDPNRHALEEAAAQLAPLLSEVVFTGGAVVGLLITEDGATPIRPTLDVDVIVEIATYPEYILFSERLRRLGFSEDRRNGAPLCRWVKAGLTLDAMPLGKTVLGFANSWFAGSMAHARPVILGSGISIRVVSAPYFLATKMEAYHGRGGGDFFASHDLEDFISVVDGRLELLDELRSAPVEVRTYLAQAIALLLEDGRFQDALPGYLTPDPAGQDRLPALRDRLRIIAHKLA